MAGLQKSTAYMEHKRLLCDVFITGSSADSLLSRDSCVPFAKILRQLRSMQPHKRSHSNFFASVFSETLSTTEVKAAMETNWGSTVFRPECFEIRRPSPLSMYILDP